MTACAFPGGANRSFCGRRAGPLFANFANAGLRRFLRLLFLLCVVPFPAGAQLELKPPDPVAVPSPQDVSSRQHLADQFLRERRFSEALGLYREILPTRPRDLRIRQGMKTCLLELKEYAELDRLLAEDRTFWPEDPSVLEQMGTSQARQGDREGAARTWREILTLQEKSRGAYEVVADLFVRNRMLDDAMSVYVEADSLYPFEFSRQKASLHEQRLELDAATDEYLRYLESNPTALSFVEGRLMRIGEGEGGLAPVLERVKRAAARHESKGTDSAKAPKGTIAGDGAQRVPGFEIDRGFADLGDIERIFYRKLVGDLCLEAGDYDGAADEYIRLASENPSQLSSLVVFGKRCQTDGAHEVAIRVFDHVVRTEPSARSVPSALTEIVRSQVELRRWDDALAMMDRIVRDYPETTYSLASRLERAHVLLRGKGDAAAAEVVYRELLQMGSGPWEEAAPQFGVAECALFQDDFARAAGIFNAIRERQFQESTREQALFRAGETQLYQGDFALADSLFKQVAREFPKGLHVNDALEYSILVNTNREDEESFQIYGKALHRLRTGRAAESVRILTDLERDHPEAPIVDEAILLLGESHRFLGEPAKALEACDRAVRAAAVADLAAKAKLLRAEILAEEMKDPTRAREQYEQLLVENPETIAADVARERLGNLKRALP